MKRECRAAFGTSMRVLEGSPEWIRGQAEGLFVSEMQVKARGSLVRELDLKPMINTALQKAIVPFVRDQVNASVKARNAGQGGWPRQQTAGQPTQFGNRQWQAPGKGGGRGTGLPPPAIGDGYFGHRKNRMGHPVTCYECQVTGHFAWECPQAGIPASGGGGGAPPGNPPGPPLGPPPPGLGHPNGGRQF